MDTGVQFKVRLPADVRYWIIEQARHNGASQNSEIIRCIRERMDRMAVGNGAAKEKQENTRVIIAL